MTIQVELDVFSGRVNPRWELTRAEAAALGSRLRGLPQVPMGEELSKLGYQGFIVHNPDREFGIPGRTWVFRGITDLTDPNRVVRYADVRRAEAFLVEQAKTRGYGPLLEELGPELPDG